MTPYTVRIGSNPPFEVLGTDSCSVVAQHVDLCGEGERISVRPGWWHERNDKRAMQLQQQHSDFQDVIDRRNV